jgi:hypothetical protein
MGTALKIDYWTSISEPNVDTVRKVAAKAFNEHSIC